MTAVRAALPDEDLTIHVSGADLPATLTLPDGPIRGGLITLHGAGPECGRRDFPLYEHLARVLPQHGIAVLRYDRRPNPTGYEGFDIPFALQADDALAAVSLLRERLGGRPVGLWGLSQGAWVAPLAAAREPDEVAFVVTVAAATMSPGEQMRHALAVRLEQHELGFYKQELSCYQDLLYAFLRGDLDEEAGMEALREASAAASRSPWWSLTRYPLPEEVPPTPVRDIWPDLDVDGTPWYAAIRCPVLAFWGEHDDLIPVDTSIRIWRDATAHTGTPPDVRILEGSGHSPWTGDVSYERQLVDWLNRPDVLPPS